MEWNRCGWLFVLVFGLVSWFVFGGPLSRTRISPPAELLRLGENPKPTAPMRLGRGVAFATPLFQPSPEGESSVAVGLVLSLLLGHSVISSSLRLAESLLVHLPVARPLCHLCISPISKSTSAHSTSKHLQLCLSPSGAQEQKSNHG